MRISDWSSDVCSSDLLGQERLDRPDLGQGALKVLLHVVGERPQRGDVEDLGLVGQIRPLPEQGVDGRDRKSVVSGKSVSVRVDLGGRRIIKQKKLTSTLNKQITTLSHNKGPNK